MRRSPVDIRLLLFGAVVLIFLIGPLLIGTYVDWLWFRELGQREVWWTLVGTRTFLGLTFGLGLTAFCFVNLWLARRATERTLFRMNGPRWQQVLRDAARQGLSLVLVLGSLALGAAGGLVASAQLDDWIRFRYAQPFGQVDPVFHQDLGFYIFRYPFLAFASGWLFGTLLLVTIATTVIYFLEGAVSLEEGGAHIPSPVRVHLSVLLGLAFLAKAGEYWLDRYALLFQSGGLLYGASYTDVHARLPALNILLVVAVVAALGFFLNTRLRALWLPASCVAFMIIASLTVGGLYPTLVQRFVVAPSEQVQEREYIRRHLEATRQAYGLENVQTQEYQRGQPLDARDLRADRGTLDNIRLWDYRVLSQSFQGLQRLRNYYDVQDVDIDRYHIGGQYRQVMLAPRQLVTGRLDRQQQSWVNDLLQYTHGYGLVMSAVNEADPAGRPNWLISDLPLHTQGGLRVTRPEIYFGGRDQRPVVAPSNTREFDYPVEGGSSGSSYTGTGGIPIGSTWMRWVFGAYLEDWNLVISGQVNEHSRVLIRRNVQDRIGALAPMLQYDDDPYLVLVDGRLVWIQDAYSTAATYPYSEPTPFADAYLRGAGGARMASLDEGSFNYIRNSVKAVVDAYTGAVTFYVLDERDPVLACYRRAFPGLFHPAGELPPSIREHLRYPEDLFTAQTRKWARFHVTEPDVFYAHSDLWEIPTELLKHPEGNVTEPMEPYYVMMRLPGEPKEEFALIEPFKTRSGTTMPAWLTARCDGEHYGQLRLYRFSTDYQVDAPEQVDATIQSDSTISSQLSLLDQRGSVVRYGNLLVLPVGGTILYVKPLYVEASQNGSQQPIPVLAKVILAEKRGESLRVVMRPTLREALGELVGGEVPEEAQTTTGTTAPGQPAAAGDVPRLAAEAEQAFTAAETAQRAGNWAEYGKQLQRTREAIRRLRQATGAGGKR